jgi:FKBP-type peptidyl-prolyl cis-trans isomerase
MRKETNYWKARHAAVLAAVAALFPAAALTGCTDDDTDDGSLWREQNTQWVEKEAARTDETGQPYYQKIVPGWAPSTSVLMRWHNDRSLTASRLSPLDNSTVDVKYELKDIEGNVLQNSYSSTTYGDSIYRSRPCQNITGFWAALVQMHEGDSVTAIMPASAAYGAQASGKVKAWSTLVYTIKLKRIHAYETPK